MSQDLWTAVDDYFEAEMMPADPVLEAALAAATAAGLPSIAVAPNQGKLLNLLVRIQGAKRILELGTLGGYSTIWLARALPADGHLLSLEYEQKHADVARANIAAAGLSDKVEVRVGPALDALDALIASGEAPYDLIFIDADKPNNPHYFARAMQLVRPGSVIICDNVVRQGQVADAGNTDDRVIGSRRFAEAVAAEPRVDATTVQTVGTKGYDGFTLALVTG
ncbi:O-methyltransferase [Acidothermaceae bacterium B102]|nr:O-methyltransferase [Acidothermaceae bacterium B102]